MPMKTTKLPASAFQSALEKAATSVNETKTPTAVEQAPVAEEKPMPQGIAKAMLAPEPQKPLYDPEASNLVAMLKQFIEEHNLAIVDKQTGKKAVRLEAWQFILHWKNIVPTFESEYVADGGVVTTCRLMHKGEEVSRSTTIASTTEQFLKDKPAYAVWGMSQTRALARAVKNVFGYLVVQAGYSATPSDEMSVEAEQYAGFAEDTTGRKTVSVKSDDEIARLAGRKTTNV